MSHDVQSLTRNHISSFRQTIYMDKDHKAGIQTLTLLQRILRFLSFGRRHPTVSQNDIDTTKSIMSRMESEGNGCFGLTFDSDSAIRVKVKPDQSDLWNEIEITITREGNSETIILTPASEERWDIVTNKLRQAEWAAGDEKRQSVLNLYTESSITGSDKKTYTQEEAMAFLMLPKDLFPENVSLITCSNCDDNIFSSIDMSDIPYETMCELVESDRGFNLVGTSVSDTILKKLATSPEVIKVLNLCDNDFENITLNTKLLNAILDNPSIDKSVFFENKDLRSCSFDKLIGMLSSKPFAQFHDIARGLNLSGARISWFHLKNLVNHGMTDTIRTLDLSESSLSGITIDSTVLNAALLKNNTIGRDILKGADLSKLTEADEDQILTMLQETSTKKAGIISQHFSLENSKISDRFLSKLLKFIRHVDDSSADIGIALGKLISSLNLRDNSPELFDIKDTASRDARKVMHSVLNGADLRKWDPDAVLKVIKNNEFSISGARVTNDVLWHLANAGKTNTIKTLDLSFNSISYEDVAHNRNLLYALLDNETAKDIHREKVSDDELKRMVDEGKADQIKSLDLRTNSLKGVTVSIDVIQALRDNNTINSNILTGARVFDATLRTLVHAKWLDLIKVLDLSNNNLRMATVSHSVLQAILTNATADKSILRGATVSDSALKVLADAGMTGTINSLNLSENELNGVVVTPELFQVILNKSTVNKDILVGADLRNLDSQDLWNAIFKREYYNGYAIQQYGLVDADVPRDFLRTLAEEICVIRQSDKEYKEEMLDVMRGVSLKCREGIYYEGLGYLTDLGKKGMFS